MSDRHRIDLSHFTSTLKSSIPAEEQVILDEASTHRYDCRCDTCKKWWQLVGPADGPKPYGPFSIEEIEDGSEPGNKCRDMRLTDQAEEDFADGPVDGQ